jgi:hypothetical protein
VLSLLLPLYWLYLPLGREIPAFFFFLVVLGFEFRALCLLGRQALYHLSHSASSIPTLLDTVFYFPSQPFYSPRITDFLFLSLSSLSLNCLDLGPCYSTTPYVLLCFEHMTVHMSADAALHIIRVADVL